MRSRCRSCERSFDLTSRKSYYQGEDAEEARRVASRLALQVYGAGIEAIAETTEAVERERQASFADVLRAMEKRPEFYFADLADEVRRLRFTDSGERVLERLLRENRVYEPRQGLFRWV